MWHRLETVRAVFAVLALASVYGLTLGLIGDAFHLAFGGSLPTWAWWQYALAVPALGVCAFAAEIAFAPVRLVLVDQDRATDPGWKRFLRLLGILAFGVGLLALAVMLRQHGIL